MLILASSLFPSLDYFELYQDYLFSKSYVSFEDEIFLYDFLNAIGLSEIFGD
jgi:hypothetical protein